MRTRWPYWNASGGADHLFLFSHDEGACWAPHEVYQNATILTHWGRMDADPWATPSSSRYMADDWQAPHTAPERAPAGGVWEFPRGGSRALVGRHPCYSPQKDLVIPVWRPPSAWKDSPFVRGAEQAPARTIFACASDRVLLMISARFADGGGHSSRRYFSGNLAQREPLKYARGVRHRLRAAFKGTAGWRLVGGRGGAYSGDLSRSEFCIVPPGGDGWSSRVHRDRGSHSTLASLLMTAGTFSQVDDAVRHGCIPVILMDRVHLPLETLLNYSEFAIRVPESEVDSRSRST